MTDGHLAGWSRIMKKECFLLEENYSPMESAPPSVNLITFLKTLIELYSVYELGVVGCHTVQLIAQTSEELL